MKVAVVGGGSTYTPELADGLLRRIPALPVTELWLVDPDRDRLNVVGGFVRRMAKAFGASIAIHCTDDLEAALEGASFILSQFRIGGQEGRILDESIPRDLGLVGQETTGAGGFASALRTVPVAVELARQAARLAPQAWLINFTNPSGLITEAITRHSAMPAVGLCNVPIVMKDRLATLLGAPRQSVTVEYAGLNHLSWITRIWRDGAEVTADLLARPADLATWPKAAMPTHQGAPSPSQTPDAPLMDPDLVSMLQAMPSPYLRYFYHRDRMVAEQRTHPLRAEVVREIEAGLLARYRDPALTEKPADLALRGGALYSHAALEVMEALGCPEGGVAILNIPQGGWSRDFDPAAVLEVPAYIRPGAPPEVAGTGAGAHDRPPPAVPAHAVGLMQAVKAYETLTIQAALEGSRSLAIEALLVHPLVGSYEPAAALVDRYLAAHRAHLPRFFAS